MTLNNSPSDINISRDKVAAIPKSKHRIRDFSDIDLSSQIDSLQRAFANERGVNERFREEVLAKLGILLQRRYP